MTMKPQNHPTLPDFQTWAGEGYEWGRAMTCPHCRAVLVISENAAKGAIEQVTPAICSECMAEYYLIDLIPCDCESVSL